MARHAPPQPIKKKELQDIAATLRLLATSIDGSIEAMEQRELEAISPQYFASLPKAMEVLTKFVGGIITSVSSASFKNPILAPNDTVTGDSSDDDTQE